MTYHQPINNQSRSDLDLAHEFLRVHGTALANAAHTLGGPAASARVFLLCEAMRHTRKLTRAQSNQLVQLHQLLTLEHVGDPDRVESGLFAQIDPTSVFVVECCSLSEKLGGLLMLIAESNLDSECNASRMIIKVA